MHVDVRELLSGKKSVILEKWFNKVLEAYPAESSGFLKNKKKQFSNPLGYTISQALEGLLDALLEEELDFVRIAPLLDSVIRIRAVQDLAPSQALAFLFHLKKIIREEIGSDETQTLREREAIESKIDAMALISFDVYMKCREKIYELKSDELRNMTYRLLQKANLVREVRGE
ncbi:MAG: RsbRD N-terminal domain-containing protein [Nitrospirae bacterium]|nr:RsbRD N-terminal domain-containing protein [Nitrospirota bacterium]